MLGYDAAGSEAGNRHKTEKPIAAFDDDARVVLDHLQARPDCNGKLLTLGVCLGGHLAFRCAFDARVRAAACFYATDIHKGSLGSSGDDSLARTAEISRRVAHGLGPPRSARSRRRPRTHSSAVGSNRAQLHVATEFNAAHAFLWGRRATL